MGSVENNSSQVLAIRDAITQLTSALAAYEQVSNKYGSSEEVVHKGDIAVARNVMTNDAMKLLQEIRGPVDTVYGYFEMGSQASAIRCLIAMGAFDKIPTEGSVTLPKLAFELGVDRKLLARLMRIVSVTGPFQQVQEDEYAHTPFSKAYLSPEVRGMYTLIFDDMYPPWNKMHEFLASRGWKTDGEERDNAYTYAHQTGGKTIWEHLKQYPERVKALNLGMGAQTATTMWSVDIVNFRALLESKNTSKDDVLVVDVGGGKGHCVKRINNAISDIEGRLVLQDRPEVISDTYDLDPSRFDKYEYDFFQPQPIKGAHIYYIRRVLHDWPDHRCVEILKNIANAMESGKSRLVIAEIVVPPTGGDSETGWMDLVLMTVTGVERSARDWEELLSLAGLKLEKIYKSPGTNHGAVQAVLA
ncbi:O-methyltransferase domain-containing protein [Trichoderma barbatum]